jgi:hypothetical protein
LPSCPSTEAARLHRTVIHLVMLLLGTEHPDTLRSMNNLATVRRELGEP